MTSEAAPYKEPDTYVAQGDIFISHVVAPWCDDDIRIFRTANGLPGYKVFDEGILPGKVFSYGDLVRTIRDLPEHEKVEPFSEGKEAIVVYGELLRYFIICSQTCDISGVDKPEMPFAAILPIIALADWIANQKLPFEIQSTINPPDIKEMTIVEYLHNYAGFDLSKYKNDPYDLPKRVRDFLKEWQPQKNTVQKKNHGLIRKLITELLNNNKSYIYYLKADRSFGVPEGFVDFSRIYCIPTTILPELKPFRIANLANPYREEYSRKVANFFGRVATPVPLKAEKI